MREPATLFVFAVIDHQITLSECWGQYKSNRIRRADSVCPAIMAAAIRCTGSTHWASLCI